MADAIPQGVKGYIPHLSCLDRGDAIMPDANLVRLSTWLRSIVPADSLVAFDDTSGEIFIRAEGRLYVVSYVDLEELVLYPPDELFQQIAQRCTPID